GGPVRRRVPPRPDDRSTAARVRSAGLDRGGRGDLPRRPPPAGGAAYAGVVTSNDARTTAERWLAAEPDDDIRDELRALLAGDDTELRDRFGGRLHFGTAGLRAAVGAGPLRMNRLV